MAISEITEEGNTASSDSTKALRSSPSANHHQNAASSSATNNENDQHEEAPPPSFETIPNDLRDVNLAWKKYTAHMNAKIYVAGKEFKRLRNLGSTEKDFDELQKAIANLQIPRIPSQVNIVSPTKTKDKSSKPSLAANYMAKYFSSKPKQLENNHQNAASSSGTTNKNDQHGEVLFPRSKMIRNDLRLVNLAWKKYTDHMNAKISVASKVFKRLQRKYLDHINMVSEEFKKIDFDKLQKAIKNQKSQVKDWQIPLTSNEDDHDGGNLYEKIGRELNLLVSAFDEAQKFKETDFVKLKKAIGNLKSQIPLTSNEDDHDGGALYQKIGRELNLLVSAFEEAQKFKETDFVQLKKAIENLKSQIPLTSNEDDHDDGALYQKIGRELNLLVSAFDEAQKFKETDFVKLNKDIENLKSQIPLSSNEDDHDSGDLDLLVLAFEEAQKFLKSTGGEINQARAKPNKLQEANFEKQRKGESSTLREDIGKLRALIRSYAEIHSTVPHRHPYEWPDINGVREERMHFFFKENEPNTDGVDVDKMMKFNEPTEPDLCCLLCFFKFPPGAFIRRTTMIYLWIGEGYILEHLQKKYPLVEKEDLLSLEEDAGKKIFDALITNGCIERCSLEPNRCKMSPSTRSSLYKKAVLKGFTPNGTRDLDAESVRVKQIGHSCLINVGEAIINCTFEIFEKMEDIHSLYFGRWQTSATHHIELLHTQILDGMSKLNNLTFLSLRGISLITELPTFISKLNNLKILDLRACHNLEKIPDEISSLEKLTHLDMSECYFLERMPKSLAHLSNLEVLKGFFIGDSKNNKQSCTLSDLSQLSKLRKLNIYTSVEKFPTTSNLQALQKFQGLLKLTISWGGCSLPGKTGDTAASASQEEGEGTLPLGLQKLDLQGFPLSSLPCWLWPSNLKDLRKLYIRGGNLCDLEQSLENQGEHWNVEILRLKYLDALEMDWSKLMRLFPKLIYLQQKECSKFNFQGYERSVWSEWKGEENSTVWMHKKAIDTRFWLQKLFSSDVNCINLSSLLGYKQKIAQHNSNTSSRSETALVNW